MRKQGSQEAYIMMGFLICTPPQYSSGDQIKKNEIYRPCSTCWGEERRGGYGILVGRPEGR